MMLALDLGQWICMGVAGVVAVGAVICILLLAAPGREGGDGL